MGLPCREGIISGAFVATARLCAWCGSADWGSAEGPLPGGRGSVWRIWPLACARGSVFLVPAGYQPLGVAGQRVIDRCEPEARPPMLPEDFAGPFRPDETNETANFSCLTGCATEILYNAAMFGPPQLGRKRLFAPCTGPAAPPSRLSGLLIYRINGASKRF